MAVVSAIRLENTSHIILNFSGLNKFKFVMFKATFLKQYKVVRINDI